MSIRDSSELNLWRFLRSFEPGGLVCRIILLGQDFVMAYLVKISGLMLVILPVLFTSCNVHSNDGLVVEALTSPYFICGMS